MFMFFIVFGTRGRISDSSEADVLQNACPGCSSDLVLSHLKQWFTLFFIPVFPFNTVDTFYHCKNCDSSYKPEAREILIGDSKSREELENEANKIFAQALVASMTHMAYIDGDFAEEEKVLIEEVMDSFPEYQEELKEIYEKINMDTNYEDEVYDLLRQCSEILTSEGVMVLISQAAQVLLADGKIEKAEVKLLKEYLLVCGLPKNLYQTLIEKIEA